MNEIQNVYEEIENIVGTKFVSDSDPICYSYSMNCDFALQGIPDIVVKPRNPEEISGILKVANKYNIKVIPRGNGADLTGGSKPIGDGGIVLDVTRMNKILDVDEKNRIVTVEVGISWSELCEKLSNVGIGYYTGSTGPASGFSASIGGGLSNNSVGGGGAAMYGAVTEQCVGLEVVLPTGEIIDTGAKANSFRDKPFTRFGLGADYSGIFLGDVGIHGVKTKASFNLYPLPEYRGYATYVIKETDEKIPVERVTELMMKWQHQRLQLHDFFYYPPGNVQSSTSRKIAKNLANNNVEGGVLYYTTVADTQKQLDYNIERIEKLADEAGFEKLGPTVEEGNLGKWFYEEDGKWQWANGGWGGQFVFNLSACLKAPTNLLPEFRKMYEEWTKKNFSKMTEIGAGGGAGFIAFGVYPSYLDVASGVGLISTIEHREKQEEIWKDLIITQIKKLGSVHYWMGEIIGRALVDSGALTEEYYNFMLTVKKALDPNKILSPGKFYLTDNY
ncbi:MAG: FAD-binding oxidoreductase [Promethearchaeota archaeon]|jgi:FAD/FMN-containing dehydrogenase